MTKEPQLLYRVHFTQDSKVYQIYARYLSEENLMGFIEVEELVFNDAQSVLVDPSEDRLREEFKGVRRTYIPYHAVMRIDEVLNGGVAKIIDAKDNSDNVSHFPDQFAKKEED